MDKSWREVSKIYEGGERSAFIDGASTFQRRTIEMLEENYEAVKCGLVDEDKMRNAQNLLEEIYEDLISIVKNLKFKN